jgi:hypothetical protein
MIVSLKTVLKSIYNRGLNDGYHLLHFDNSRRSSFSQRKTRYF